MPIESGSLEHRVLVWSTAPVVDLDTGQAVREETYQFTRWMAIEYLKGDEDEYANKMVAIADIRFRMRLDAQTDLIEPEWLFRHGGMSFEVVTIDPQAKLNEEVHVYTKRVQK